MTGHQDAARPGASLGVVADITPLRFLVLSFLIEEDELAGRDLRDRLLKSGVKSSGPQFYQMMARIEDSGYVQGWYAQKEIEHQVVNERRYRITEKGRAAWRQTGDFYSSHTRPVKRDDQERESAAPSASGKRPQKSAAACFGNHQERRDQMTVIK